MGVTEAPNIRRAAVPASASTQIAPQSSFPSLPLELLFIILSDIWEEPQTRQQRQAFEKNATLVNRIWLALVAYITSRDVHIHTGEDGIIFILRLYKYPGGAADLFTAEKMRVTNNVCRSVTFHVDGTLSAPEGAIARGPYLPGMPPWLPPAVRMRNAIGAFLYNVGRPGDPHWQAVLPHLRHIVLRYTHWAYDDTLGHLEHGPFPPQVTHLSIQHAFPDPFFKEDMCERWLRTREGAHARYAPLSCRCLGFLCMCGRDRHRAWRYQDASNVRHLSLSGATAPFAIAVLGSCRGIETLELELEPEPARGGACAPARLDAIAPLPPATRTVVLRHPGLGAVNGEEIRRWRVCEAVQNGLFPQVPVPRATRTTRSGGTHGDLNSNATGRRIVVHSGPLDLAVFESARRECGRFGVELVHEPNGFRSGGILSYIRRGVRGDSRWRVARGCGVLLAAVLMTLFCRVLHICVFRK